MDYFLKWIQWIYPLACLVGSLLAAVIFKRIVLDRLKKIAVKTKWAADVVIVDIFRKYSVAFFVIGGFYLATLYLPVTLAVTPVFQKILLVCAISVVTLALTKLVIDLIDLYAHRGSGNFPSISILSNLARVVVLAFGVLMIMQSLGIPVTPILTALGVGGLAVALAMQETLSNLFAGLHILISRQVRSGDYIQLNSGEEGYVADINWRNTTIRTLPNNMVIVPNSKLSASIITNFYQPAKELSFLVEIGVSYGSNLTHVEKVTTDVAREVLQEVSGGVQTFEPFIRYHTFADFSINFSVILRAKEFVDQYLVKHEFLKRLHERYQIENIEIPFPTRIVRTENNIKGTDV